MVSKATSNRRYVSSENRFRLNPLVAGMRMVVAGGFIAGSVSHAELPVPVPGAGFVTSGSATQNVVGNTLHIDQQSDRAILNWQSFNVGKDNIVKYEMPDSTSIALNRINQADPSRIFGQIIANGQVYLYNRNGFVFGENAVVNANSFLASTLNITDEVFNRGITRVYDEDGRAALAFEGELDEATAGILVKAGAKITVDKAGRIILAAPNIENNGKLTAGEQGQIIVAASKDKVYLQPADKESPFAGLVVEVDTGGKVTNNGEIGVRQGNVTLAGFAVNQQGRISATTSVNVNGSIRLVAQEKQSRIGGKLVASETTRAADQGDGLGTRAKVRFANGSVTEVIADSQGGSAIDEQVQPESYVEVKGHTVSLENGSAIVAPGGTVAITASNNPLTATQGTSGRIHIDNGATIDVSGYENVPVEMKRNIGEISVQSYELRDAPVQKDGPLKGETVKVDLRQGSDIVDTSGAEARISRGIQERLGKGGDIKLTSSGDVVVNNGAKLDISGGSIAYQGGFIETTKLTTSDGRVFDISNADPDQRYVNVVGTAQQRHEKWGVVRKWSVFDQFAAAQYEPGYVHGLDAGSLSIKTPALLMNGQLLAGSTQGVYQRELADRAFGGSFTFDSSDFVSTLQSIRVQAGNGSGDLAVAEAFPFSQGQPNDLILSQSLINDSGVQRVTLKTLAKLTIADDAKVNMTPGGEFAARAAAIDVYGSLRASGGDIDLAIAQSVGGILLAQGSELDVSGGWVNDFRLGLAVDATDPVAIDGGRVSLRSVGDLTMQQGASIRADGGAWLDKQGQLTAGDGGAISLIAGGQGFASRLHFDGTVSAAAVGKGGRLTLGSADIVVGDGASNAADPLRLGVSDGRFDFDPQGGFSDIQLQSTVGDVVVTAGTKLDLKTASLVLNADYVNRTSGADLRDFSRLEVLPEHLRQGNGLGLTGLDDVKVETGASLAVDKAGSLDLSARLGSVYVDGTLRAPGGNVTLAIKAVSQAEYNPSQSVRLGGNAKILAQGDTRLEPVDALGRRSGQVLDGGKVLFDLERGSAIFEQGSLIDVSGTHTVLELPKPGTAPELTSPTQVFGNAGKIDVVVAEAAVFDGQMLGWTSSDEARGGRFSFKFDRTRRGEPEEPVIPFPNNTLVVRIRDEQQSGFDDSLPEGANLPTGMIGQAILSTNMLEQGGFEDVRVSTPDLIRFEGDVGLSAKARIDLDAGKFQWTALAGETSATVSLDAGLIRLGSSLQRSVTGSPLAGGATFNANAQWLELVGGSRWDGFKQLNLSSANDLRTVGLRFGTQRDFVGTLVTAANIELTASQVYPSTLSEFTFAVRNNGNGKITVNPSGNDGQTPLSAAGKLVLDAPVIEQNGVLKAPLGDIHLKASQKLTLNSGSVTSVSGDSRIIPFGVLQAGLDWLYPLDSIRNLVFATPPEKKLVLEAPEIEMLEGSSVDLSGGGDLFAYEFIPGNGGSFDHLNPNSPAYQGGFAILPTLGSQLAPFDHYEYNFVGWQQEIGSRVYLSGSEIKGLAAGEYTVLPAHYALLPGAYLITPEAGSQDLSITSLNAQGLPIVAGYFGNALDGSRDSRWSGFRVENGDDVRLRAQFDEYRANSYFRDQANKNETAIPLLPNDAGQISLIAQTKLVLESQFMVNAVDNGRGARMDIAADQIRVVDALSPVKPVGVLEILDDDLSALSVDSLLLGGSRQRDAQSGETRLSVGARKVTFASGSQVSAKDLLAAASEQVSVDSGAALSATGPVNTGDSAYTVAGDGALLRLSGDRQVSLLRTPAPGVKGQLSIESGATLSASKSMLLDASQSTLLQGEIVMKQGSLNLGANTINLGEVDHLSGSALNLSNAKLTNLTVDELVLTARDSIGLYGNVGQVDAQGAPLLGDDAQQKAIRFKSLVIDSAGLTGHGDVDDHARIHANSLTLQNSQGESSSQLADGLGRLTLSGDDVRLAGGELGLNGFEKIGIDAGRQWRFEGDTTLAVAGELNVRTPAVTAGGGARLNIDAAGHEVAFNRIAPTIKGSVSSGFGARLAVTADSIDADTHVLLPSGSLELQALQGDVSLSDNADIDLAGRNVRFADTRDYTPGGSLLLSSAQGRVLATASAAIDLSSGGGVAKGGLLRISAPTSSIDFNADLAARRGSVDLDIKTFEGGSSFDALMALAKDAGIDQSIRVRVRDDAIQQASDGVIRAADIELISDRQSLILAGRLDADGQAQGGSISLHAGDQLILDGARLTARGVVGGKVLLSSTDVDGDAISGLSIQNGSNIDVSGSSVAKGGEVTLRALRDGGGVKAQLTGDSSVQGYGRQATLYDNNNDVSSYGYSRYTVEAVRNYVDGDGELTNSDYAAIKADTDAYMTLANMQAVENALGARLQAGVDVRYAGNLTVVDKWDLVDWRYSDGSDRVAMPGTLTLRAAGNLTFAQSLSDGFKDGLIATAFGDFSFSDMMQSDESWSYRLVAGADLTGADWASTATKGNLTVGSNATVRTGTGDMALVAGGDVVLTDQTSTVYSAGRTTARNPYGTLPLQMALGILPQAEYPIQGGDLQIRAGGNIQGAQSSQFINGWMMRQGGKDVDSGDYQAKDLYLELVAADLAALKDDAPGLADYIATLPSQIQTRIYDGYKLDTLVFNKPTTWGLMLGNGAFQQNVGSFGGGAVNIEAAGDINNLSVVMPTSGKQVGQPAFDVNNPQTLSFLTNEVTVNGGGQMAVKAGGDIAGGVYYLGLGQGAIEAGGDIQGGSQFSKGPHLLMGDAEVSLLAGGRLSLGAVSDPMMLHDGDTNFFSYGDNSRLAVRSLSGDVTLNADVTEAVALTGAGSTQSTLAQIYPAGLTATAFGGDVVLANDIVLFPAPRADVNVLAAQNFRSQDAASRLAMSDADRGLLPTMLKPVARNDMNDASARINPFGLASFTRAATPVHAGDDVPVRIVANAGDIDNVQLNLAKQAVFKSGRDLRNSLLIIQHANAGDSTLLDIGRDLKFTSARDLNGQLIPNINEINVLGPGELLIKTGRHLDLGAAVGISTTGNLVNANLPDGGAGVSLLVGLNGKQPAYAKFIESYLGDNTEYSAVAAKVKTLITSFMRDYSGDSDLTDAEAFSAFKQLTSDDFLTLQPALNAQLVQVYVEEIKLSGSASAGSKELANERGYRAIETLFPGEDWRGDLSMFFSKIHTLDNGSINLLVPGGQVNAGLAVSTGSKKASQLGIVAQRQGDINAVVRNDFLVNQSRVFALDSGDIAIWSSEGNIDAGRGAKSAIAAPPPEITFDQNGNMVIVFPPIVSGSGIRTAGQIGRVAGDVYLFAPKGVVDAGEAGIGGTNVTISAVAVLGANNIQVGGIGTGVPVASTGSLAAGLTGAGNLSASVSQMAESSINGDVGKEAANSLAKAVLGMLTLDFLGFGD